MNPSDYFILSGDYHHIKLGEGAVLDISAPVTLSSFTSLEVINEAQLIMGRHVFFNDHCSIRCHQKIQIGKDTMFGDGCRLYDHNHEYSNYHTDKMRFQSAPIVIGNNWWIGSNTVILKGVTIGDNVIIGANCLIYKDIPSNSIVKNTGGITIE